ncbi:hypothetical protein ASG43_17985 [Aureimonas sp. Leaf454]|uniref:hypothetical protein n=1 Tax=Aureimonas sp. Leaf454 TaxID=1736381 RepID=UPI0006FC3D22|nr:hypothetical protein [Aureimonas sp. Leaf454]KQT53722.1 hypothetical protein ASG43_17985 [Aureimonas sp. Leaf454]
MSSATDWPVGTSRDADGARAPIRISFVRRTSVAAMAFALVAIAAYAGASRLGETLKRAGASSDPTPIAFRIGAAPFAFPGNAVRFSEQRADPAPPELDLYLMWPELTGFSDASAEIFHDPEARRLLFVTLSAVERRDRDTSMSGLASPTGRGPAGLMQFRLAGLPGIASDEIVYRAETGPETGYEVSCLDGVDPIMAADCIREIEIGGGLRLRYRFTHHLLAEWKEIDRAVLRYVAQHRRS